MPEGFTVEFWYWWVAALVLIGLEVFAPGFIFVWLAIAAASVGGLLLLAPEMSWQYQWILFALLSLGPAAAWLAYRRTRPTPDPQPGLNQRAAALIGQRLTLKTPIQNGRGHAMLAGGRWTLTADEDLPAGSRVKIVATEGMNLRVEQQ